MSLSPGTKIDDVSEKVKINGDIWEFQASIYDANGFFNVCPRIERQNVGFFDTDPWKYSDRCHRVDDRGDIENELEDQFQKLVNHIKEKQEIQSLEFEINARQE